jgi:glycosyltransferase involved in cell wall biosynthesis
VAKKNSNQIFAVAGSINKKVFAEGLGFECPDNMKLLGYVTDEEAKTLMRDCRAFLFPTVYEGFGIPPLEAISVGAKCVVVSDTDVMHEIFGDCVNYVSPNDIPENLCFQEKENADSLLEKYSWEKSARKLKEVIRCCQT